MTQGWLNDLLILHVHNERVNRLDLGKIAEYYVSGREDTEKIGSFLRMAWEFCRIVTLLKLTGRHVYIYTSFDSMAKS